MAAEGGVDNTQLVPDPEAADMAPMATRRAAAQKLPGSGAAAAAAEGEYEDCLAPSADNADLERTPRAARVRKRGGGVLERPAKVQKLDTPGLGSQPQGNNPDVSDMALETQVVVPQPEEASSAAAAKAAVAAAPAPAVPSGTKEETAKLEDDEDAAEPCVVCLEPLGFPASSRCTLGSCGHTFHIGCILQAFRRSRGARCPLCRGTGDRLAVPAAPVANPASLPEDGVVPPQQPAAAAAAAAEDRAAGPTPVAHFRLITESPLAAENQFLGLSSSEFRSVEAAMLSLGRTDITRTPSSPSAPRRSVCGRAELMGKVPRSLTVFLPKPGIYGSRHPIVRFVNREVFLFEILESSPTAGNQCVAAVVSGLTAKGLHVRSRKQGLWRWFPEGKHVELAQGDCISFVLEAPVDSDQSAANKDFSVTEATCLLGLELVSFEITAVE